MRGRMDGFLARLFPVLRSITGPGVRETLRLIQDELADDATLNVYAVPSGTQVLDWTVPDEWYLTDAFIKDASGERVVDVQANNLHVLNYSAPVHARMTGEDLLPHLHALPEHPEWIPYRTSYYKKTWGFCVTQTQKEHLDAKQMYEVMIDSRLEPGVLNYADVVLPGQTHEEIFFSTHICHPSMANDNLSGVALMTYLIKALAKQDRYYTYRFAFVPGTIGAITYLAQHEQDLNIKHGLVITGVGDSGALHYKQSRQQNAIIDQTAQYVLEQRSKPYKLLPWEPYGYDERQYCSPGFNLPVGRLSRTPYAQYPEYHTSADNLDFISSAAIQEALEFCLELTQTLEANGVFLNTSPKGEPQLGRRGLYDDLGGSNDAKTLQLALLWVLNLSDGEHSLLHIAQQSGIAFKHIAKAQRLLLERNLLVKVT